MADHVVRGSIRAELRGRNIVLGTTHRGGLVRRLGSEHGEEEVVIEHGDIDDAIDALITLRLTNAQSRAPLSVERYVRAQSGIIGWDMGAFLKPVVLGVIELGLHYERGEKPSAFRSKLSEVGEVASRVRGGGPLDEDAADAITEDLDRRIVGLWGDRPRFIEVWRGIGDDAEPLSQVYAPHGMPRFR